MIYFGFSSLCTAEIMKNGGQEMLDELYADNKCDDSEKMDGIDLTLKIPMGALVQR